MEKSVNETRDVLKGIIPLEMVIAEKDVHWEEFLDPREDIAFGERLVQDLQHHLYTRELDKK